MDSGRPNSLLACSRADLETSPSILQAAVISPDVGLVWMDPLIAIDKNERPCSVARLCLPSSALGLIAVTSRRI